MRHRTAGNLWEDAAALAKLGKEQAIKSIAKQSPVELTLKGAVGYTVFTGLVNSIDGYRTGDMSADQGSTVDVMNQFNVGVIQATGALTGNSFLENGAEMVNKGYVDATRGLGVTLKSVENYVKNVSSHKIEKKENIEKEDKESD